MKPNEETLLDLMNEYNALKQKLANVESAIKSHQKQGAKEQLRTAFAILEKINNDNIFGDDDYYYEEITFKSNGTFIVEWEEFYDGDYDSDTVKGTYEIDGDEIIVEFADEISIITIVSITSNKIVIEDEYGDRLTYHRK